MGAVEPTEDTAAEESVPERDPAERRTRRRRATGPNPGEWLGAWLKERTPRIGVAYAVAAVCAIVYAVMVARGAPAEDIDADTALAYGAELGTLTVEGEWWRLVTNGFVHLGGLHVLLNVVLIVVFGRFAERALGPIAFGALLVVGQLGSSLVSMAWQPDLVTAGASGMLFAILGALLVFALRHRATLAEHGLGELHLLVAVCTLVVGGEGLVDDTVDNAAHIGGFFVGILAARVLLPTCERDGRTVSPGPARLAAALLIALALLPFAVYRADFSDAVRASSSLAEGRAAHDAEEWERAVELLGPAIEYPDLRAEALALRASARIDLGELEAARADCDQAIGLDPGEPLALRCRGHLKILDGDPEAALPDLDRSLYLDPDHGWTLVQRSVALLDLGRHEDALADLDRASEVLPDNAWVHASRGRCLVRLGRSTEGIAALMRALQLDPLDHGSRFDLARAASAAGRTELALQVLDPEMVPAEGRPGVRYERGHVQYRAGRWREARSEFRRASHTGLVGEPDYYVLVTSHRLGKPKAAADERRSLAVLADDVLRDAAALITGGQDEASYLERYTAEGEFLAVLARFYAATARLLRGDREGARELFEAVVEARLEGLYEVGHAAAELERLDR